MTPESDRLSRLRSFRLTVGFENSLLDATVRLAAHLFNAPIAAVTFIDEETQWFMARHGVGVCSTTLDDSICAYSVGGPPRGLLVIENAIIDPRFAQHPAVVGGDQIRFYVGAVLTTSDGFNLGSLCIADTVPRLRPSDEALGQLRDLADLAVAELERARTHRLESRKNDMLAMAEAMSGVGHWHMSMDDRRVIWSDEVYRVYGVDRADFDPAHDDARAFFPLPDRDRLDRAIARCAEGLGGYELALDFDRADGARRQVVARGNCDFDADGKPLSMFGIFQDVTDHTEAVAAAEEAARVKSEFLANMSHELRTPLSSIIGFTKLAREQADLPSLADEYLRRVDNAGRGLLALLNDILDFSRLEVGQVAIRPLATDIQALCRDTVDLFAPQAGAKDLLVHARAEGVPNVDVDADRVRQILVNMVGNAVKFTDDGSVMLTASWVPATQRLRVVVADTGPGISEAQRGQLFQRFSQVDESATRSHGGAGLGLAICKGLAEAMGGVVGVESEVGRGSRFWFEIPAPKIHVQPESIAPAAEPEVASARGARVLVADDHPANRELARLFLTGLGADVALASDGLEAVAAMQAEVFDVVLMDVRMPGLDGREAMLRGRTLPTAPRAVLAYTADGGDREGDVRLLAQGFDGVVAKPVNSDVLAEAVRRALAPGQSARPYDDRVNFRA